MEMAKSDGLLTVLGLTKAEQELDLARVRQRSCLVLATHCPNAAESRESPSRAGADLSWVLRMGHPSTHSADTGSSNLPQHKQNPQRGSGASSFLVLPQSPREFNAEESSWAPPQAE